jgi:hypothetical protein
VYLHLKPVVEAPKSWVLVKLEAKYLRISKLVKHAIKSYLKNSAWCEMS